MRRRAARSLADLRADRRPGPGLEDRRPARDLWPGIAARIGAGSPAERADVVDLGAARARRRWSFSLPQLAAAGIALMALSGGAVWLLHPALAAAVARREPRRRRRPRRGERLGTPVSTGAPRGARATTPPWPTSSGCWPRGGAASTPTTVRVIEQNLATIDSAIAQAQRAVAADSANVYLNSHLAETMRRKLELLRQAAALVSSVS